MPRVYKAATQPPLNKTHELKLQDWAKKYLKTDFSKVLWTDEMRVTVDGPDGRACAGSVTGTELHLDSEARWYGLVLLKMI